MGALLTYLHRHRSACRRLLFLLLPLLPLLDAGVGRGEAHFLSDRLPGFWSLFGLAVCLLLVVCCKWLARVWLEREEGYYDR